jgi:hypothetical protein
VNDHSIRPRLRRVEITTFFETATACVEFWDNIRGVQAERMAACSGVSRFRGFLRTSSAETKLTLKSGVGTA